ncbi:cellulase family glycosylhydrolase [Glycomyces niveus]|uniref:cellulase n=1 Tax=Glycomyces niveus TaxID=2820287 RepID=A0ABS3U6S4_9ACTN|nr:cellulase family glycosylhydrolase [Glycomyces sp. NEAU-S30]MBO3734474.1 cellulase family glycosylhydrolase [Glycomyces sp. NEAU-S30]
MSPSTVHRRRLRLGVIAGAAVTAMTAGLFGAVSAQAAQGCEVEYEVTGEWPGGFIAAVEVTNLGEPVDGWNLEWTWPDGQRVTNMWNAKHTGSGETAKAESHGYNAKVATGDTAAFGFTGSWSGENTDPTEFRLNGRLCDGTVGEPTETPTGGPQEWDNAVEQVADMEPSTNIGNTLDALGGETAWGNPMITEELLQTYKAEGYNSIRLPVTWDEFTGPAPDYTIAPERMERVAQVVDWALENDLQVMINLHHDSWMWLDELPNDHDNVMAKFEAMWTQIAERFKDYPDGLSFESNNEPQFVGKEGDAGDPYNEELNRAFYDIVRASGGNNADRLLVLPTLNTNAAQERLDPLKAMIDSLNDDMVAATIHYYGFWPFSVNVAGFPTYNAQAQEDLAGSFKRTHDTFVANGIPVIVGEWAILNYGVTGPEVVEYGEMLKFFEDVQFQAREYHFTTMIWDAIQFLNRNTLEWHDPYLQDRISASWTTRSGATSFDRIYLEKAGTIGDVSQTLDLNGLEFEGVWDGETQLVEGTDYTLSGDTLTFKAATLTRLAGDRAYGTNATIEARFSAGVPWRINIITFDQAVLSDATGTGSLVIPTQWNGDHIEQMEAHYADGSNAGPAEWTAFQESQVSWLPDYINGSITVPNTFVNAIRDGEPVTITYHLWGGESVDYTVVKNGTTVTGTAS